jgi:putative transposase
MPGPKRISPRLREYDYASAGAYFITACTRGRACLVGAIVGDTMRLNRFGKVAEACWAGIPRHLPAVTLDAFVVMPNHIHGIVCLTRAGHALAPTDMAPDRVPGLGAKGRGPGPGPVEWEKPSARR